MLIFSAFIDQTRALHHVFLLIVCTTGMKISRIFLESDEYLIPCETAKSVKSLGLKDNATNQIRMKIYSVHIQTAWVETKTVKE